MCLVKLNIQIVCKPKKLLEEYGCAPQSVKIAPKFDIRTSNHKSRTSNKDTKLEFLRAARQSLVYFIGIISIGGNRTKI